MAKLKLPQNGLFGLGQTTTTTTSTDEANQDSDLNKQDDVETGNQADAKTLGQADMQSSIQVDTEICLHDDNKLINEQSSPDQVDSPYLGKRHKRKWPRGGEPRRQTYYVDEDTIEALYQYAFAERIDKSEIVRAALRAYIPEQYWPQK